MKYNTLGQTGLLVSEICLGTMTFGGQGKYRAIGQQTLADAKALIQVALDAGVNFLDNANVYSQGLAEEMMGQAIRELGVDTQKMIIATKLGMRMGEAPNDIGLSRFHIHQAVDASLKRLQRTHIDLLYLHSYDPLSTWAEVMRGLEDVVRSGKVRYLGICNHPAWMVAKANGVADWFGWTPFSALQYYYSLSGRDIEHHILPLAKADGLSVILWSPLAGGFLSGKFDRHTPKAGNSRRDEFDFPPLDREKAYDIIDTLRSIAQRHQVSAARVALRWVMNQPGISSTIIGAKNLVQLRDNLEATSLQLSPEDMEQLDQVSQSPTPYPNWMMKVQTQNRWPSE